MMRNDDSVHVVTHRTQAEETNVWAEDLHTGDPRPTGQHVPVLFGGRWTDRHAGQTV